MKDYAKKNYSPHNKKPKTPFFLLIGIIVVIIAIIYSFHLFQHHRLRKSITAVKTQTTKPTNIKIPIKTPSKAPSIPETDKSSTPDFDFSFYKMLPKMHVTTPNVQTSAQKIMSEGQKQYFLQVASSKDKNGADILIKQLATYGFPTSMTTTQRRNTRWYHVFLGPYPYLNEAKTDQYRLYRDFHMNGILRVVNKKTT